MHRIRRRRVRHLLILQQVQADLDQVGQEVHLHPLQHPQEGQEGQEGLVNPTQGGPGGLQEYHHHHLRPQEILPNHLPAYHPRDP